MFRQVLVLALLLGAGPLFAADKEETTKVEGTIVVPKEVPSFEGRLIEVRLYSIHPRIADKAADLVEKGEIKNFDHKEGKETKKEFVIGAQGKLDPARNYYVTLFLLDNGKRTHIGESASGQGPTYVLTGGKPNKVTLKIRPVGK